MASTYSDRLKLELMETGANANTWGNNTNTNLETLDAFAAGYLSKSVAGSSNITLTTANASDTAESSNKTIELTGALTGDIVVFIPAVESEYNFFNNTSGSQTLTIAATGHTANGIAIAQGAKTTVFCDGASNFNVEIISSTDAGALGSGTLPDARFPATLPAVSGVNLTSLNASNLGSGTVPDARFPATLPQTSGANLTNLNASNVASGTLGSDRLPTVPTTKGGTGLTSVGSAGQVLTVSAPGSALEFADAAGGGVGNTATTTFNSPGTFTANAATQFVGVTVIGGGGGGGGGRAFENSPSGNPGGTGGSTTFGSLLTGAGGSGGIIGPGGGPQPAPGGSGGGGSGNTAFSVTKGNDGNNGQYVGNGRASGGTGGSTVYGVGNGGSSGNGRNNEPGMQSGGGGGGGGAAFGVLAGPAYSPSVAVTVGNGGSGGSIPNGAYQNSPSAGNAGRAIVTEFIS